MLTLDVIKNKTEEVIARLAVKHFDGREKIERIIELDKTRRGSQNELDARLAELKKLGVHNMDTIIGYVNDNVNLSRFM